MGAASRPWLMPSSASTEVAGTHVKQLKPRAAMHAMQRYMWARLVNGSSYEVVVTTLANAHALHSSTGVDAPLSGFAMREWFFLDPSGTLCEPLADSTLAQAPSDVEFEAEYSAVGIIHPGAASASEAQACIVAGRVLLGVTAAEASALSRQLLKDVLVTNTAWSQPNRLARAGRVRRATATDTDALQAAGEAAAARDLAARELGKTPVAQSAGARRMLIIRVVWRDEGLAQTMSDATYLAYASKFVAFANNRSYGNSIIVPTYTTGCVYKLPNHTSAQVRLGGAGIG